MDKRSRVLGVLAGQDLAPDLLAAWVSEASWVLAADSGANRLAEIGASPAVVLGDMDSISIGARGSALHEVVDTSQETTDCDKLLAFAAAEGVESITLTCIEGDLPDHVMATLNSVARSPLNVTLAYRRGLGHIVRPSVPFVTQVAAARRVSLLPLDHCEGVSLRGVVWPLEGSALEPTGLASISNRSNGGELTASVDSGVAFLFVERTRDEVPRWH